MEVAQIGALTRRGCLLVPQVRPGSAIIGFCGVGGAVLPLGEQIQGGVEAAAALQDISVLYVPQDDLALAQQKANERGGMEVRGVARVEDLLVDEGGDAGLWVSEA